MKLKQADMSVGAAVPGVCNQQGLTTCFFAAVTIVPTQQQFCVGRVSGRNVTHVGELVQGGAVCAPGAKGVIVSSRQPALLEPYPASLHASRLGFLGMI